MSDEKVIRVDADVRKLETNMARARRVIADTTAEIKKMNVEASKGLLSSNRVGQASLPGVVNPTARQGKSQFEILAKSSQTAMRSMTETLRTEGARQQQLLAGMKRTVDGLNHSWSNVGGGARQGTFGFAHTPMGSAHGPGGGQLGFGGPGWNHPTTPPGPMQGPQAFGPALTPWAPNHTAATTTAKMYAAVLTPIGVAIGRTVVKAMTSGLQEAQTSPHDYQRREMMRGEFGSAAQQIRHGDYSLVHALQMVRNDPKLRKDIGLAGGGGDLSYFGNGFKDNDSGGINFNQGGRRVAGSAWSAFKKGLGLDFVGAYNDLNRDLGDIPFQKAQEQLEMARRVQDMKTVEFSRFNMFQANTASNEQNMATFGMGAGYHDRRGRVSARRMAKYNDVFGASSDGSDIQGLEYHNDVQRMLDRTRIRTGITTEQLAGGYGAVQSTGGFGTAQRMGLTAAIGQRGHMSGAGQTLGLAAMGGDPNKFWASLNHLVGRGSGGLDVSAVDVMGSAVANTIPNGAAPTSGLGLLGAGMTNARGGSAAEDMLKARFMGAGIGMMGDIAGGKVDAYQSGSNLLAAIQAAPKAAIGAQEYLSRIDPRVMFDVVGGAPLPPELKARGLSAEAVKQYASAVMRRTYDRQIGVSPNQGGVLSPAQQQTQDVQAKFGGSFQKYYQSLKSRSARTEAITNRGVFLGEAYNRSDMEAQSFARLEAGMGRSGTLADKASGRGVADYAAGSTDRLKETKDAVMLKDEHTAIEGMDQRIRGTVMKAKHEAAGLAGIGTGDIRIENVQIALDNLVRALNSAASKINDDWSHGGTYGVRQ